MGFHRKWFRWRAVRDDSGYEVAFVGMDRRARKVKYSDGKRSITVAGEPVKVSEKRWGLHFALQDRYLGKWDDGSETTHEERETVRNRFRGALEYMRVRYTLDSK